MRLGRDAHKLRMNVAIITSTFISCTRTFQLNFDKFHGMLRMNISPLSEVTPMEMCIVQ
jgi:hypothetical protein